jgi:hypothetical protein
MVLPEDWLEFEDYCGAPYLGGKTVVFCTRNAHDDSEPHENLDTGFRWQD